MSYSPGEATQVESDTVWGLEAMLRVISGWVQRIHNELVSGPIARANEEQQKKIDELTHRIADVEAMGSAAFTKEEAEQLTARITALETELVESIKSNEANSKAQQEAIAAVVREMNDLKAAVSVLDKKGVARKMATWVVTTSNAVLVKMIAAGGVDMAKKLLLP